MTEANAGALNIGVEVGGGAPEAAAHEAAQALMAELAAVRGLSVDIVETKAAPGSKSIGLALAEIVAALGGGGALVGQLFGVVKDWLGRQPPQTKLRIKDGGFEFEWSGATPPEYVDRMVGEIAKRRAG